MTIEQPMFPPRADREPEQGLSRRKALAGLASAATLPIAGAIPATMETHYNRFPLLENYRDAEAKQLLTPAPTAALAKWKQNIFAQGQYKFTGVKKEQIEKAIADDLAFLAAHAVRRARSNLP